MDPRSLIVFEQVCLSGSIHPPGTLVSMAINGVFSLLFFLIVFGRAGGLRSALAVH